MITGILRNETLLGKIKERLSEFCLVRCDFNRIQQYVDSKGCKLRLEEIFSDDEIKFILNLSEEEKKELLRILLKLLKQQGIEFGKVGLYKFGIEGKEEYAFVISK